MLMTLGKWGSLNIHPVALAASSKSCGIRVAKPSKASADICDGYRSNNTGMLARSISRMSGLTSMDQYDSTENSALSAPRRKDPIPPAISRIRSGVDLESGYPP